MQMRDSELYQAIRKAPFVELPPDAAIAMMKKAEGFAEAVLWVVNGVRSLRSRIARERGARYRDNANEVTGF